MNIYKLISLMGSMLLLCGCGSNGDAQHKVASLDEFNKLISFEEVEYLQTQSVDESSRFEYAPNIVKFYYSDGSQRVRYNNNGAVEEYNLDSATAGVWAKSVDPSPWGDESYDTIRSASPKYTLSNASVDIDNATFNYDSSDYLYKGISHFTNSNAGDDIHLEFGFINHKLQTFDCYVLDQDGEKNYWYREIYTYFTQIVPNVPDVNIA